MNEMDRHYRPAKLPDALQGSWNDTETGNKELLIEGFDVSYRGVAVRHEWFELKEIDGALCVDLGVDDAALEDQFQRENLSHLVIDPDGHLHGYNSKFAVQFARAS